MGYSADAKAGLKAAQTAASMAGTKVDRLALLSAEQRAARSVANLAVHWAVQTADWTAEHLVALTVGPRAA